MWSRPVDHGKLCIGMAGSGLWRGVERAVNQGLRGSRDALDRARSKARELGERGALRLDLLQLERQRSRLLEELGALIHDRLGVQGQATVSHGTPGVKDLMTQIDDLTERCVAKREALELLAAQGTAGESVPDDEKDQKNAPDRLTAPTDSV